MPSSDCSLPVQLEFSTWFRPSSHEATITFAEERMVQLSGASVGQELHDASRERGS